MTDENKIDRLFKLISKEDVVLFVGAGVSRCVGLPSGAELSIEIHKLLPKELRQATENYKYNLPKIASQYVCENGVTSKYSLIMQIRHLFECKYPNDIRKTPLSVLARAPHFKYIISTNYDNLIENSIGEDECIVVANDESVPKSGNNKNKTVLIKIHGDFDNCDRIVLTTEDYNSLYQSGRMDTPIWNLVKNLFATKTILFLGYSLGDGNIDSILSSIGIQVKTKKQIYFLSPNIPLDKKNELQAKNIISIDIDFETFFQSYFIHYHSDLVSDFNAGLTSHETLVRLLGSNNIIPIIEGNKVSDLKPQNPQVKQTIEFSFGDLDTYNHIIDPDYFDPISIKTLSDFKYKVGDFIVPKGEISELIISKSPAEEFTSSIYFFNTDFEIRDVQTKIYRGKTKIKAVYQLAGCQIIITVLFKETGNLINFEFKPMQDDMSIQNEIEWLSLMENFRSGGNFRLTTSTGVNITPSLNPPDELKNNAEYKKRLEYLLSLRKIEKYYGILFSEEIEINDRNIHNVNIICRNIDGNLIDIHSNISIKATIALEEENSSALILPKDNVFMFIEKQHIVVNLHGQRIDLGYRLFEATDPEYLTSNKIGGTSKDITLNVKEGNFRVIYQSKSPYDILAQADME